MTIWIDQPIWPRHGTVFAHLISDTSLDELHAFADRVGLHPRSFEGDHYDVPQERYALVLSAGATSTTGADVVRRLIASGLRLRKRRGDRPVARVRGVRFPDGTVVDVDLVASEREVDVGVVVAALVFVQDRDGRFAVVYTPRREAWGSPGGALEQGESAAAAAVREVREETGLELAAVDIEPCAYERFEVVGELPRHPAAGPQLRAALPDHDRGECAEDAGERGRRGRVALGRPRRVRAAVRRRVLVAAGAASVRLAVVRRA